MFCSLSRRKHSRRFRIPDEAAPDEAKTRLLGHQPSNLRKRLPAQLVLLLVLALNLPFQRQAPSAAACAGACGRPPHPRVPGGGEGEGGGVTNPIRQRFNSGGDHEVFPRGNPSTAVQQTKLHSTCSSASPLALFVSYSTLRIVRCCL